MKPAFVLVTLLALSGARQSAGSPAPAADSSAQEKTADEQFEKLLTLAMKDIEKADWRELRRAFAKTTHYQPYNIEVDEKLKEIAKSIGRGEFKESEEELLKLVDRDRFMRFDSLAMLMMLYEKMDEPKKVEKYKKILDRTLSVLAYPKSGVSLENPIEVLYVQEEYLVTTGMPVGKQELLVKDGHRYDVLMIKAEEDKPARRVYFNIDLLTNSALKLFDKE